MRKGCRREGCLLREERVLGKSLQLADSTIAPTADAPNSEDEADSKGSADTIKGKKAFHQGPATHLSSSMTGLNTVPLPMRTQSFKAVHKETKKITSRFIGI